MTYLLPVRVADSCGVDQKRRQTIGQWQGRRRAWQVTPPPPHVYYFDITPISHIMSLCLATVTSLDHIPHLTSPSHCTLSSHLLPILTPHPVALPLALSPRPVAISNDVLFEAFEDDIFAQNATAAYLFKSKVSLPLPHPLISPLII